MQCMYVSATAEVGGQARAHQPIIAQISAAEARGVADKLTAQLHKVVGKAVRDIISAFCDIRMLACTTIMLQLFMPLA